MILEEQRNCFIKHLQNGDKDIEAIKDFISVISESDKKQLATMKLKELEFLTPLSFAAKHNHHEVVKTLLDIQAVKDNAAAEENQALWRAADEGNLEIVETLLMVETVKNNAAIGDNEALRLAAFKGHHKVVNILLAIPDVRDNAAAENNEALCYASLYGHHKVVKILLAIPVVKDNAAAEDNEALCWAVKNGHHKVIKVLLTVKAVQQGLLANGGEQLISLINTRPIVFNDVIDILSIYGMPLSKLMETVPQKERLVALTSYIANPLGYLAQKGFNAAMIAAVNIYYSAQLKTEYEQRLADRERESVNNVDDEAYIGAVKHHYAHIIKPYLREAFEQYGETDVERIIQIESQIREMLLKHILAEAKEKQESSLIAFIEGLSDEQRKALCEDTDEAFMAQARERLTCVNSDPQTAWRAYDKQAKVSGDWPNLLAPALDAKNSQVYTVRTVGLMNPTLDMASQLSREMAAFAYLLVIDKQDGDDEARADRETIFISKIAEIRNAHNPDDPSCLPGTVSRISHTWAGHSKAISLTVSQLLEEEMGSLIAVHFQKALSETQEQEALFEALVMLSSQNAEDVIAGKAPFSDEAIDLRQAFIDSLGTFQAIEVKLNGRLTARNERALTQEELNAYVPALLADIGGPWNIAKLMGIYKKYRVDSQTLMNPWSENLESTVLPTSSRMTMQLMNFLQGTCLRKNSRQIATLFLQKSDDALRIIYEQIADEGKRASVIKKMNEIVNAPVIKHQKAMLWDQLYPTLKGSLNNRDSEEKLKSVVLCVVDDQISLEEAMALHFPENTQLVQKNKSILSGLSEHKKRKREENTENLDKKSPPTKKAKNNYM